MRLHRNHLLFILFLLIVSPLFFWRLGNNHLSNWDEAWYADVSRHMVETGNLFTPTFNGRPFFDKPPLYYWLSSIAMWVFGVSEWSVRIVSAVAGLSSVILVYLIGSRIFLDRFAAYSSGLILISTIGFLYRARTGNMDTLLTFGILLTIWGYLQFVNKKPGLPWFFWGIIISFFTKGIIAFIFPLIAFVELLLNKFRDGQSIRLYLQFFSAALFVCISWVFIMLNLHGQSFTTEFTANQLGKITPDKNIFSRFSLDYLWYLKSGLKIWFVFLPIFIFYLRQLFRPQIRTIVLYILFTLTFLSFSVNKSDWFLIPFYPLIALGLGFAIIKLSRQYLGSRGAAFALSIIILIASFQLIIYRDQYLMPDVAVDEARVALKARELIPEGIPLYLTNYYFPTTIYYSRHQVYAVYSDHEENASWWVLPVSRWAKLRELSQLYVITTTSELPLLIDRLAPSRLEVLFQSGEKLLVKI